MIREMPANGPDTGGGISGDRTVAEEDSGSSGEPRRRPGFRAVLAALLVFALLVALGLLLGPEYWRF